MGECACACGAAVENSSCNQICLSSELPYSRTFLSAKNFVKGTVRQFVRNLFSSNGGRRSFVLRSFGRRSFAYRLSSHS